MGALTSHSNTKMRNIAILQFGIQLGAEGKRKEWARSLQYSYPKFDKIKNAVEWNIFRCFNFKNGDDD